ncbi:hypothetical protein [Nocardia panacis]|uniref:hypothetical protein n=1 Tax=Nocardia panacis TaxID=2340916 RepID=UPI0011C3659E|nr:hypothetical protein [Nocardia panacis]
MTMTLLAAGCGTRKETNSVDHSLTEEAARQQIFSYLQKTADATGLGFSMQSDRPDPGSPLEPAGPVPCYDGYQERGPHQIQASYWVVGVPHGQVAGTFALLQRTWTNWGWRLDPEATTTIAGLATLDHYSFILRDSELGDGWLSVTGASPCFPYEGLGATTPQPTTIKPAS